MEEGLYMATATTNRFDAVIVGSGFGGSVMAYRLAQEGFSVCVLERGKKYPPGSFARSPLAVQNNFWDPSRGLYGLFNIWSFRGMDAIVSSGVGGGSLIYGNVLLRKDEKWFVIEDAKNPGYKAWPVTRAELDPHYDNVERMMNAQKYPHDHEPYRSTPKTQAIKLAADELIRKDPANIRWESPNLAVTFANAGRSPVPAELLVEPPGSNLHNSPRTTCRLCGECLFGCNYGSKNTLDYNYLPQALKLNAEIRPLSEVRSFQPLAEGGYLVKYVVHTPDREGINSDTSELPLQTISADRLILAAGAVGSTYLLMKNRPAFPNISATLGSRFGGNGDQFAFAVKCHETVGGKRVPRKVDAAFGPVITSAIRIADKLDGGTGRGLYIEDMGYSDTVNWIIQMLSAPGRTKRYLHFIARFIKGLLGGNVSSDLNGAISDMLTASEITYATLFMIAMGRAPQDGVMRLNGKFLDLDWNLDSSREFYARMQEYLKTIAETLQADFIKNPEDFLHRSAVAHPLGGCPMGGNDKEGVVDSRGEVFNYPGLFVADGAVMPGPVGPNPALTIAAIADRIAALIIERSRKG